MEYQIMVGGIEIQPNEQVNEGEARAYISYIHRNNPKREIPSVKLSFGGEGARSSYHLQSEDFEKIRRVTGYLAETVDRFSNGKRTEEHSRIKHAQAAERCFFSV